MKLKLHSDGFAICKLPASAPVPSWVLQAGFSSVTRTADELSIVCKSEQLPPGQEADQDWRSLEVEGPLEFSEIGILAALSGVLAAARISIFVVSTYDTDFVLIKNPHCHKAIEALSNAGHIITD